MLSNCPHRISSLSNPGCFVWDPSERLTPKDATRHPWIGHLAAQRTSVRPTPAASTSTTPRVAVSSLATPAVVQLQAEEAAATMAAATSEASEP